MFNFDLKHTYMRYVYSGKSQCIIQNIQEYRGEVITNRGINTQCCKKKKTTINNFKEGVRVREVGQLP